MSTTHTSNTGIKHDDTELPNLPKICHICKMPNSPESGICRCGKPLDLKNALELEEVKNFKANKIAAKALVKLLTTKQIPDLPKEDIDLLIESLRL